MDSFFILYFLYCFLVLPMVVPLASINVHIDEELQQISNANASGDSQAAAAAEGLGSRVGKAPIDEPRVKVGDSPSEATEWKPDINTAAAVAIAAPSAPLPLRWRPDAVPSACKYGE